MSYFKIHNCSFLSFCSADESNTEKQNLNIKMHLNQLLPYNSFLKNKDEKFAINGGIIIILEIRQAIIFSLKLL